MITCKVWTDKEIANLAKVSIDVVRPAAPCPMVNWLSNVSIPLGEGEQQIIWTINQPGMTKNTYTGFLGIKTVVCNSAGFGKKGDPRANYIKDVDTNKKPPVAGKCYVFGGATLHGEEKDGWLLVETIDVLKPLLSVSEIKRRGLYSYAVVIDEDGDIFNFGHRKGLPVIWPLFSKGPVKVKMNNLVIGKPIPYITRIA